MFRCIIRNNLIKRNGTRIGKHLLILSLLLFTFSTLLLVFAKSYPKQFGLECPEINQCAHHASCYSTIGSYICKCDIGFFGDGINCYDINECKQDIGKCETNQKCINNIGSYFCECESGYYKREETGECVDLDECTQTKSACSPNADCTNYDGSFNCSCKFGYTGNGKSCKYNPKNCVIPKDPAYKHCEEKVRWMTKYWKTHPCYAKLGVDGSICTILQYLAEVERQCPLLPGRQYVPEQVKDSVLMQADTNRLDITTLITQILHDLRSLKWIRERIKMMWDDWVSAFKSLTKKQDLTKRKRKNVLVFIGILAEKKWSWADKAGKGGPLGELVQWADLITSVYLLGHHLIVSTDSRVTLNSKFSSNPCGGGEGMLVKAFDMIYIDMHGLHMFKKNGVDISSFKCKLRILDSFGTEARFNYNSLFNESEASLNGSIEIAKALGSDPYGYGHWMLHLKQFMTMFPHSPDNSFLGFVVGQVSNKNISMNSKQDMALVYGKQNYMYKGKTPYLSLLSQLVSIHGTVSPDSMSKVASSAEIPIEKLPDVPRFVVNHGLIAWDTLQKLLQQSKIFIGLGFPFEGPAPLEAIANGAVFLNPKWKKPLNRLQDVKFQNKYFFEGKPTLRDFTSQHPYMESFVGRPHTYTIDVTNKTEVMETMKNILEDFKSNKTKPYLPFEFTNEGMLQRVNTYIEKQNFCSKDGLMPQKLLRPVLSNSYESCKVACVRKGFICENELFRHINSEDAFEEHDIKCSKTRYLSSLLAPYVKFQDDECTLQKEPLLFSCVDAAYDYRRLCPCREFIKGQIAMSPNYL